MRKQILFYLWLYTVVYAYYIPAYLFYFSRGICKLLEYICRKHSDYIKQLSLIRKQF